jgi:hypothetical protein
LSRELSGGMLFGEGMRFECLLLRWLQAVVTIAGS